MLYESAFLFILFAVCSYLLLKKKFRHNMSLYLVAYGIFRFLIEYVRGDDRGQIIPGLPISPSQFWSIFMVLIGVGVFFLVKKLPAKAVAEAEVEVETEVEVEAEVEAEAEVETEAEAEAEIEAEVKAEAEAETEEERSDE